MTLTELNDLFPSKESLFNTLIEIGYYLPHKEKEKMTFEIYLALLIMKFFFKINNQLKNRLFPKFTHFLILEPFWVAFE